MGRCGCVLIGTWATHLTKATCRQVFSTSDSDPHTAAASTAVDGGPAVVVGRLCCTVIESDKKAGSNARSWWCLYGGRLR